MKTFSTRPSPPVDQSSNCHSFLTVASSTTHASLMPSCIGRHGQHLRRVSCTSITNAGRARTQGNAPARFNAVHDETNHDLESSHRRESQCFKESLALKQTCLSLDSIDHAVITKQRYHECHKNSISIGKSPDSDGAARRFQSPLSSLFAALEGSDSTTNSRSRHSQVISTSKLLQPPPQVLHHLEYCRPVHYHPTVKPSRHIVSSKSPSLTHRRPFSTSIPRSEFNNGNSRTHSAAVSELERFLSYPPQNPKSTTYQGTRYEHLALHHLTTKLNFNLTRVGGRNDIGVDLIGSWEIPFMPLTSSTSTTTTDSSTSSPQSSLTSTSPSASESTTATSNLSSTPKPLKLNVLIQCKSLSPRTPANPNIVRELTGTISTRYYRQKLSLLTNLNIVNHDVQKENDSNDDDNNNNDKDGENSSNNDDSDDNKETTKSKRTAESEYGKNSIGTLGIVICTRPATKGVRDAMTRNHEKAIMWICMQEDQQPEEGEEVVSMTADTVISDTSAPISTSRSTSTSTPKPKTATNSPNAIDIDTDTDTTGPTDETTKKDRRVTIPSTKIHQILWNNAASNLGLHGFSVGLKYNTTDDAKTKEAVMMWRGEPIDFQTHNTSSGV